MAESKQDSKSQTNKCNLEKDSKAQITGKCINEKDEKNQINEKCNEEKDAKNQLNGKCNQEKNVKNQLNGKCNEEKNSKKNKKKEKEKEKENMPTPLILNQQIFESLYNHGTHLKQGENEVILVFDEVPCNFINPLMGEDEPTHCTIFCVQHINTPLFQPLGTAFYNDRPHVEKFETIIKAYIRDINACNLNVVCTLSPPKPSFTPVVELLTKMSELEVKIANEPLVYKTQASSFLAHVYCPDYLLINTRCHFLRHQIYYLTTDGIPLYADIEELKCAYERKLHENRDEDMPDFLFPYASQLEDAKELFSLDSCTLVTNIRCTGHFRQSFPRNSAPVIWFFYTLSQSFERVRMANGAEKDANCPYRSGKGSPTYVFWEHAAQMLRSMNFMRYEYMDSFISTNVLKTLLCVRRDFSETLKEYSTPVEKNELLKKMACDTYHMAYILEDLDEADDCDDIYRTFLIEEKPQTIVTNIPEFCCHDKTYIYKNGEAKQYDSSILKDHCLTGDFSDMTEDEILTKAIEEKLKLLNEKAMNDTVKITSKCCVDNDQPSSSQSKCLHEIDMNNKDLNNSTNEIKKTFFSNIEKIIDKFTGKENVDVDQQESKNVCNVEPHQKENQRKIKNPECLSYQKMMKKMVDYKLTLRKKGYIPNKQMSNKMLLAEHKFVKALATFEDSYQCIDLSKIKQLFFYPFTLTAWTFNCHTMKAIIDHLHDNLEYDFVRTKSFSTGNLRHFLHFVKLERNKNFNNYVEPDADVDGDLIDEISARFAFEKECSVFISA